MALPAVNTVYECTDFGTTVVPFLSQLNYLPSKLVASGGDLEYLKEVYLSTNPFVTAVAFTLSIVPLFVLLSEVNKNYSQVDRVWSILPVIYNAHYSGWAHLAGLETERLDTVLIFSIIWGVSIAICLGSSRINAYAISSRFGSHSTTGEKVATKLAQKTIAGRSFAQKFQAHHYDSYSTYSSSHSPNRCFFS